MGESTCIPFWIFATSNTSSGSATTLCAQWKKICLTKSEHVEDFELMDENASTENQRAWQDLVKHADMARLDDVSVMDIYNVKLPNGMPLYDSLATGLTDFQPFPSPRSMLNSWRQSFHPTLALELRAG